MPEDIVITDQSATEVNVRVMGSRAALRRFSTLDVLYPVEISGAKPGRAADDEVTFFKSVGVAIQDVAAASRVLAAAEAQGLGTCVAC